MGLVLLPHSKVASFEEDVAVAIPMNIHLELAKLKALKKVWDSQRQERSVNAEDAKLPVAVTIGCAQASLSILG